MKKVNSKIIFIRLTFLILLATCMKSAFGSPVLVGWDYSGFSSGLVKIDTATGEISQLTSSSPVQIEALAFNPTKQTLFGVVNLLGDNQLVTINPQSGIISEVGYITGFNEITSMTFDETSNTIFALDQTTRTLLSINQDNASPTVIGHYSFGSSNAIASDPNAGDLYGSLMGIFGSINKSTGGFSMIGDSGVNVITGLDFLPSSNILYGMGQVAGAGYQLFTIDTTTGQPNYIGSSNSKQITSIEFIEYSAPIPEPNSILLIGAGIGGLGFFRRKCMLRLRNSDQWC